MRTLSQFDAQVVEIKNKFYRLIKHPYLDRYLADPDIDEDRIRFICAMLNEKVKNEDIELYTISTLLVHAALDIHEAITLHNATEQFERRKGQLEVLAGDYYSSLYYYLLAKNDQLPMIQVFSHTIQDINEYKMNIYRSTSLSFEEVEENVIKIESILLQKLAAFFELEQWEVFMRDFFYLKRLFRERHAYLLGEKHALTQALLNEIVTEKELLPATDKLIERVRERLLNHSAQMNEFEDFAVKSVEDLFRQTYANEKVAEER